MKAKPALLPFIGLILCTLVCLAQAQPASESATTNNVAADPQAEISLIEFQDLPLTSAIENLARQAKLNYILDPDLPYGQPTAPGQPAVPQPNISVRWEKITAEQALSALLTTYKLQLVEDPKTHVSRIAKKSPDALEPLVTRIIQLKYTGVTNLIGPVQSTLTDKRSKVVGDQRTSQLVIVSTEKELAAVDELVTRLDLPTRQVLIEARLMEINSNPSSLKGIDWSGTLQAQSFNFGNGGPQQATTIFQAPGNPVSTTTTYPGGRTVTTTSSPDYSTTTTTGGAGGGTGGTGGGASGGTAGTLLGGAVPNMLSVNTLAGLSPAIGFLNADGVHAVLSFLNADADTQVISTPRAVTLDNETADLSVTRAVPIFKNTAGTQGSQGGSEVQYTNVGTILKVTPRISANDFIWLKVVPEVSSVFRTVSRTVNGQTSQADEYDIRKIETQVMIPSGNTLVMGGLMSERTRNAYTKVPILGDVPLLGRAFSSEAKSRDKQNLLIFITPTVVKDSDYQPAKSNFLKTRPTEARGGLDSSTPYNSARRFDWSNPGATPYEQATFDDSAVWSTPPPRTSTAPKP